MDAFMRMIRLRFSWEPVSYGSVLLMAYLNMLLCWDLIENKRQLFGDMFSTVWGVGIVTTVFMVYILFQMTFRDLISLFSALLVTLLALPLIVLCFSYVYAAYGACDAASSPELCIYHSVAIMTSMGTDSYEPVGILAMYYSWQAFLGLAAIPVLISQFLAFAHEYKRAKLCALAVMRQNSTV